MKYLVAGYGSLMSHDSLKRTIEDRPFRAVAVKEYIVNQLNLSVLVP